jgi:hypothetical protein
MGQETTQGGGGEEAIQNLGSQIFNLQQIVGDFWNEVNLLFCNQRRQINLLSANGAKDCITTWHTRRGPTASN